MKKYLSIILSVLVYGAIFTACGSSNSPEDVAEKYVAAVVKLDFSTMKKYATTSEIASIEKQEKEAEAGVPKEKEALVKAILEGKNEFHPAVLDEKNPDLATVKVKHTSPDGKEGTWTVKLMKEEGNWKVSNLKVK